MDKPMPNWAFAGMSFIFKLRDFLFPREDVLKEAGIKPGFQVLDYGCGPGGYVLGAAELVGESGMVYALDIHPLAVQKVQELARKNGLTNIKTIQSDCQTGLADGSIDLVLLYDIFHMLSHPQAILAELHRVLKPDGILSFDEPHMDDDDAISRVIASRLFELTKRGEKTLTFALQEK